MSPGRRSTPIVPVPRRSRHVSASAARRDRRARPGVTPLEGRALLTTPTVTALGFSAATLRLGQSEVLTATVTTAPPGGATPTGGTVTFRDGSVTLGSQPLVNGTATLSLSTLSVGDHGLSAVYSGDGVDFAGSSSPAPQASAITTVAGGGTPAPVGDGGPATAAAMMGPSGVALDGAGDVFIVDSGNGRVRRVDHATGVITTVAGDGTSSSLGDGGPATAAGLNTAFGVAVDASGDLFITEANPNRVRRVDHATGVITTVAGGGTAGFSGDGGPATAAALGVPGGVALDASGDVFIADTSNQRVRRVDHATGVITTVAGDGTSGFSVDGGPATAAALSYPQGVAVDASGDLFIDDGNNNRVRRVDHATGVITTVAGDGTSGFSVDGGPATAAALAGPEGVAVDASGHVFIADTHSNRVREVTPVRSVVTVTLSAAAQGGDFDGDNKTDLALFDPKTATWLIQQPDGSSRTVQLGAIGDTAAPGDYEGTGKSDLATYTPATATWTIRTADGTLSQIQFGDPAFGDVAVQADYDGDGKTDLAVFRPGRDLWIIRPSSGGPDRVVPFGDPAFGDTPVPGDYNGDGTADFAVFRPLADLWIVRQADGSNSLTHFGDQTKHDVPAPGSYDGSGRTGLADYRPATAEWIVRDAAGNTSVTQFGPTASSNVPARSPVVFVPDVRGIGKGEQAVFRPGVNLWIIRQTNGLPRLQTFGVAGDTTTVPVPGDYEGIGRRDLAVYRPSDATWFISKSDGSVAQIQFGDPAFGDVAVPADYDGDGKTDLAVFRPGRDLWIIRPSSGGPDRVVPFGDPAFGDTPVPADYDGDGTADFAVFRPGRALWIVRQADGSNKVTPFGDPASHDAPAPDFYDASGLALLAVYRRQAGFWIVHVAPTEATIVPFGDPAFGDEPARSPVVNV